MCTCRAQFNLRLWRSHAGNDDPVYAVPTIADASPGLLNHMRLKEPSTSLRTTC